MRFIVVPILIAALKLSRADVTVDRTLIDEERATASDLLLESPSAEQRDDVQFADASTWTNTTAMNQSDEQRETLPDRTLKEKKKAAPNVLIIMTDQHRFDAIGFIQDEMKDYNGKFKVRIQW
jgi:hypothetical protein